MSGVKMLNPQSEVSRRDQSLQINAAAAKGLQEVLKSNLGPKGTIKMLVSGAGDIRITKDGSVLLHDMQIQHPTASLIARAATAQDDMTGDGTTSQVIMIGEMFKQSERYISEGVHPRVITDGLEIAKQHAIKFLDTFKTQKKIDRETLIQVASTSLHTKLQPELAKPLAAIVADAILLIRKEGKPVDLFMVEIMHMKHRQAIETRLVNGLVMDHGARHPNMPTGVKNAYILTCNVSMEYEKSEVNSSLFYSNAEQRVQLAAAERKVTDETVRRAIALKKKVCTTPDKSFVIVNQKGIDPTSLQMLADEGIIALRRAKRRNMERLTQACGGVALNSLEENIDVNALGYADDVYEHVLGEDKYTFVEGCKDPSSCTILIKGPDDHTISQIKDAIRDGLRAVKNAIEDNSLVMGAGAFEIALSRSLMQLKDTVEGKSKLGIQVFADSVLIIPKTLAENGGFDAIDVLLQLQDENAKGHKYGVNLTTGKPMDPEKAGVWDNYCVKKQILSSAPIVATQLLLVDVIMRAGKTAPGPQPGDNHPLE